MEIPFVKVDIASLIPIVLPHVRGGCGLGLKKHHLVKPGCGNADASPSPDPDQVSEARAGGSFDSDSETLVPSPGRHLSAFRTDRHGLQDLQFGDLCAVPHDQGVDIVT
jgi:hypothetical protein